MSTDFRFTEPSNVEELREAFIALVQTGDLDCLRFEREQWALIIDDVMAGINGSAPMSSTIKAVGNVMVVALAHRVHVEKTLNELKAHEARVIAIADTL